MIPHLPHIKLNKMFTLCSSCKFWCSADLQDKFSDSSRHSSFVQSRSGMGNTFSIWQQNATFQCTHQGCPHYKAGMFAGQCCSHCRDPHHVEGMDCCSSWSWSVLQFHRVLSRSPRSPTHSNLHALWKKQLSFGGLVNGLHWFFCCCQHCEESNSVLFKHWWIDHWALLTFCCCQSYCSWAVFHVNLLVVCVCVSVCVSVCVNLTGLSFVFAFSETRDLDRMSCLYILVILLSIIQLINSPATQFG